MTALLAMVLLFRPQYLLLPHLQNEFLVWIRSQFSNDQLAQGVRYEFAIDDVFVVIDFTTLNQNQLTAIKRGSVYR